MTIIIFNFWFHSILSILYFYNKPSLKVSIIELFICYTDTFYLREISEAIVHNRTEVIFSNKVCLVEVSLFESVMIFIFNVPLHDGDVLVAVWSTLFMPESDSMHQLVDHSRNKKWVVRSSNLIGNRGAMNFLLSAKLHYCRSQSS